MPSTSYKLPTAAAQTTTASVDWANVSRITASDNSRTTNALDFELNSEFLIATGYDFSEVPPTARIDAVYVLVEGFATTAAANINQNGCYLSLSGSAYGASFHNATHPTATSETNDVVSSVVSALGVPLFGSHVRDSTFGVRLQYAGAGAPDTMNIDSVQIKLDWSLPATSGIASKLLMLE